MKIGYDKKEQLKTVFDFFSAAICLLPVIIGIAQMIAARGIKAPTVLAVAMGGALAEAWIKAAVARLCGKEETRIDPFYKKDYKETRKQTLMKAAVIAAVAGLTVFSFVRSAAIKKEGNFVTATVVSQEDKTEIVTDSDGEESVHEKAEVVLEYDFSGKKTYTATIDNVRRVYSETLEISVDGDGNFIRFASESKAFLYAGLCGVLFSAIAAIYAVLKVSPTYLIPFLFGIVGSAMIPFINYYDMKRVIFAELTPFSLLFISLSLSYVARAIFSEIKSVEPTIK